MCDLLYDAAYQVRHAFAFGICICFPYADNAAEEQGIFKRSLMDPVCPGSLCWKDEIFL